MVHMIDDVRKTVLTALNKENRGYLTPEQFNLYAKQAQMNIFNLYFSEYNKLVAMKNARRLSSEHGDTLSALQEKIDSFVTSSTVSISGNTYPIPSNMYQAINLQYFGKIAEKVSLSKSILLGLSNMTTPSELYPTYTESNGVYKMNPSDATEDLVVSYIKVPEDPVWTYQNISASEDPIFNPNLTGYQDFEIPAEEFPKLVLEILKLAGVTIRDAEVIQAATGLDTTQYQKENS
jgi:molybdopterin converting factor small subunit